MDTLTRNSEKKTLFLLGNGDINAAVSQELYEYAVKHGICQIDERALKPERLQLRRRKESYSSVEAPYGVDAIGQYEIGQEA